MAKIADETNDVTNAEVIEISDFFTRQRGEEGVWYEPTVYGQKIGIEFCVYNGHSVKVAHNSAKFQKQLDEAKLIKDDEERQAAEDKIYAERATDLICGMRGVNGRVVKLDGKVLEYSSKTLAHIFLEAPDICLDIISFAMRNQNFTKKKND